MFKTINYCIKAILAVVCVSCSYYCPDSTYRSIAIDFVQGDPQGYCTYALIHTCARQGLLYRSDPQQADLCLHVELNFPEKEMVGFNYEQLRDNFLSPREARLKVIAHVTLNNAHTQQQIAVFDVEESVVFDFEADDATHSMHQFSLGQLERSDAAEQEALKPLYDHLASKIFTTLRGLYGI